MKSNSVLIVGCGDLGARTGQLLLAQGWQVTGVRRDTSRLPPGITGLAADYSQRGDLSGLSDLQPDFVIATFTPADRSPRGYRSGFADAAANLLQGLGDHRPQGILMASSTRVVREREGGWVDEDSPLALDDPLAAAIIEAEQQLLDSTLPVSVVRFGGIYGAGSGRLLTRVGKGQLCPRDPPRYSNRIHRDDCAGFLVHLLGRWQAGESVEQIYLGVDDQPALQFEVESWLAQELGLAGDLREAASGRPVGHKRCRNTRLRDSGYQLRYPDYRSGYAAVLAQRIKPRG